MRLLLIIKHANNRIDGNRNKEKIRIIRQLLEVRRFFHQKLAFYSVNVLIICHIIQQRNASTRVEALIGMDLEPTRSFLFFVRIKTKESDRVICSSLYMVMRRHAIAQGLGHSSRQCWTLGFPINTLTNRMAQ